MQNQRYEIMKEGRPPPMITRNILVTEVMLADGTRTEIYGKYDAVALAHRGAKIINAEFKKFNVKEEDFVKISKERN